MAGIQACLSNPIHCFTLGTLAHRIDHCLIPKTKDGLHPLDVDSRGGWRTVKKNTNKHPLSEWTTCVLRSECLYSISLVLHFF